jgi:sigma-B regulation protein RsbU (phosphoserine phosphatase)
MKAGKRFAIISITLVMLGYSAVSYFLFQIFGLWIDVFYPLITVVVIYVALSFKKYVAETRKREVLEKELNIARDIQRSFLPTKEPADTGLDIAARMYTANQVGGDLYDLISLDDGKAGIMIGDVSGKGVPAALFMARVVSVFKTYVHEGSPARIIGLINDRLVKEGGASLFVTLSYAVFDTRERIVRYASGGHLPIIAIKPDGSTSLLDVKEGIPLGLLESDFSEGTFAYVPGTVFLFCTDGVTEAMNTREEMFGQEKLLDTLSGSGNRSAGEIVRIVHDAVSVFEGKAPQHDDITIIAVKA